MKGVYSIRCLIDGRRYIGSSKDIKLRWYEHKSDLRKNNHGNSFLQNAFNKYGEENFIYEVVEETEDYLTQEQFYIDSYGTLKRENGYNFCMVDLLGTSIRPKNYVVTYPDGREEEITNMHEFCRNNEDNLDASCMIAVAHGDRNHHKRYKCRPEGVSKTEWEKSITRNPKSGPPENWQGQWRVKHPDGKVEVVDTLFGFCKEHGLCVENLWATAHGKVFYHKGYSCVRHDGISEFKEKIIEYKFIITFPDGKELPIKNLSEFCKNNDLSYPCMIQTRTKGLKHKGFSCRQIGQTAIVPKGRGKTYLVTTPDGEELIVHNLAKFSATLGFKKDRLNEASRTGGTYKGYKCKKLTENNHAQP